MFESSDLKYNKNGRLGPHSKVVRAIIQQALEGVERQDGLQKGQVLYCDGRICSEYHRGRVIHGEEHQSTRPGSRRCVIG